MAEHQLTLNDRQLLQLTGINRVLSFDENTIGLNSEQGKLLITGQQLHITLLNLDDARVNVEGQIDGLQYQNADSAYKVKSKKVMKRLFK